MLTTTQRELRYWVNNGYAIDITNISYDQAQALLNQHYLEKIAVSPGLYGLNGVLLRDETGMLYAITSRSSVLFQLL